jgi:hypothetical protein
LKRDLSTERTLTRPASSGRRDLAAGLLCRPGRQECCRL